MARSADRAGFDLPVRLTLVEKDLDSLDAQLGDLRTELRTIRQVLQGILVSVTVAAIMLALNLVVGQ